MKQFLALALALSLSFTPAAAQDGDDGFDLMEEGAKLLLRGLMQEIEPTIDELEDMAQQMGPQLQALMDEMGPAFAELMTKIDNIRNYDAPEILPNGDIIIRRRPDAPAFVEPDIEL